MLPDSRAACGEQLLVISALCSSGHFTAQASDSICLQKELEEEDSRGDHSQYSEEPGHQGLQKISGKEGKL